MDSAVEKPVYALLDAGSANSTASDIDVLRADTRTPTIEYREVQQNSQVRATRARWRLFANPLEAMLRDPGAGGANRDD